MSQHIKWCQVTAGAFLRSGQPEDPWKDRGSTRILQFPLPRCQNFQRSEVDEASRVIVSYKTLQREVFFKGLVGLLDQVKSNKNNSWCSRYIGSIPPPHYTQKGLREELTITQMFKQETIFEVALLKYGFLFFKRKCQNDEWLL